MTFINAQKVEADAVKEQVTKNAERLAELEKLEAELGEKVKKIMMIIPNIIDPSVPIGKDDSENVEIQKYGDPFVPDFEVPYQIIPEYIISKYIKMYKHIKP